MFPDESSARKWFENIRWPDGVRSCPYCSSSSTATGPGENPAPFRCPDCRQYFSVKTGTAMHRSKISLQKWVFAIYLLSTSLKGVSSMKLHRDLGLTQRTAWLMAQKIRQGWIDTAGKLEGEVELDETSIGGKEKNKHESQQLPAGQGPVGKSAVVGARSRDSKVKARPVASASQREVEAFASKAVEAGATVYTDDHKGYGGRGKRYRHETVNHSVGEYVRERAHTNGIESFWVMLKRGYQGTYYRMRGRHLRRYVTEFVVPVLVAGELEASI